MKKLLFLATAIGFANFATANEIEKKKTIEKSAVEAPAPICCWKAANEALKKKMLVKLMNAEQQADFKATFVEGCAAAGGNDSPTCV